MINIYNKYKYRNGEWGKHFRSFSKKIGNRKWRRTSKTLLMTIDDDIYIKNKKLGRMMKNILFLKHFFEVI